MTATNPCRTFSSPFSIIECGSTSASVWIFRRSAVSCGVLPAYFPLRIAGAISRVNKLLKELIQAMNLAEVKRAIVARKLKWVAGETPVAAAALTSGQFGLRRTSLNAPALQVATMMPEAFRGTRPAKIDWRTEGRVSPIRSQDTCGSCVAFATCAAMESALAIQENEPASVDLSEADLFYCGCGDCCDTGWDFIPALGRASQGVGLEADFPYVVGSTCKSIPPAVKVSSWKTAHSADDRRWALVRGPVVAGMRVFDDFRYYKSGVYEHATGDEIGLHAVCVVGYDDDASCWIVKNSWSSSWGEDGFCRIAYGQCGLDQEFPFIAIEVERL
ncbi:hypothetical protein CDI09_09985 [Komagataeibacter nataicola]|uniref:Peptidase C1A papain C-terminal domain-containing protein n=2 Tax=Acetobacteraceae TaxID=433 RepID=A0ABX5PF58_9PROT|nr:hypothetical protein CDI09_09985 [Komagataeibacter nataicola]